MTSRRRSRLARLVLAFAVVMVITPLATALAADETVVISSTLEPKELTISPGTTVIWVNEDSDEHRMRSDDGPEKFDSGNLGPGESYTFNFAIEGSYPYIDDRNEDDTSYHGTITVGADAPPPGDPGDPAPPPPTSGDVSIVDRSFQPSSLTVGAGATVTWANNDNDEHTVTATDSAWDSGIFGQGGTYSRTFATSGTYAYLCLIHPDMTGTITVTSSTGEPPPPAPPPPPPAPEPEPAPPPAAPGNVNIVDFSFDPVTLTVTAGATVTWANAGAAPHTVTANGALFDSGFLFAGDTYQRTFATVGTYAYFCSLHPEMTATIVVNDAGGEPAPPGEPPLPGDPATPPGGGGSTVAPAAGGIAIVDNAFSPASKTVTTGTTLVWTNTGAVPHTVTSNAGGFDSGIMLSGDTYRRTFTQPGTFDYLCSIHPSMTGTITVTGSPTGPAPPDEIGRKGPLPDGGELSSSTAPSSVAIFDNGYDPGTTAIAAGLTISWANTGALPHTVTARDGSFDSGILMSGDGYSRRFTTPGSYEYFCSIHPEMVATVVVTEATGPIEEGPAEEVATADDDAAPGAASDGNATAVIGRNVQVVDNDFVPGDLTVEAGQAVRWTNAGAIAHTVTAADAAYDSGILNPGDSFEHVFAEVGLFEYLCTLHPEMVGTVEVVPARAETLTAGVGSTERPGAAVAFILAGAIVAAVGAFAIGMVRFGRIARQER